MSAAPGSVAALSAAKAALAAGDIAGAVRIGADWAHTLTPPPGCGRCGNGNAWLRSLRHNGSPTAKLAQMVVDMLRTATMGPAQGLPDYVGARKPFEWQGGRWGGGGRSLAGMLAGVDAGFPAALWAMYASTGIRPEWIVPVLYSESGLNPAAQNSIGCVGINQACPFAVPTPADYTSWTASQQLTGIVTPMYRAIIAKYGPLQSGTRVYQGNFLPATLATATSWSSIIATQGGAVYAENSVFDYTHSGVIRVSDLGHFVGKAAASSYVQSVIASAYAAAPAGVGSETDPVLGIDFAPPSSGADVARNVAMVVGILGLGAAAAWVARQQVLRRRWLAA